MARAVPGGNWLYAFQDWTVPRSEAQESLILWSGLFTLASVLKRKVRFPREIMGSYDIYPNLYVIYVGPPGVIRKSTTAGYAEDLLRGADIVNIASTAMSASQLVKVLAESDDGSVTIISSEFASFVNISQEEMYDVLTDLYDGKKEYEMGTRAHGVELAENPCVNMLAATTPEWVAEHMPVSAIGGGFARRVIFVYESTVRQRELYYDHLDWRQFKDLGKALRQDLQHIAELEGSFRHDSKDTKEAMREWYIEQAEQPAKDERITGYLQTKHVHVHKVAMLLSVAERDDLVIDITHFRAAKAVLEDLESNMPKVFSAVGKNPYSADLEGVLEFINRHDGPVPRSKIAQRFYHNLDISALNEILAALEVMGDVEKRHLTVGKKKEACYLSATRAEIDLE